MVLRLLLILLFLVQPGCLSACDPFHQPQEIFSSFIPLDLTPGLLFAAVDMIWQPGFSLPAAWESVDPEGFNAMFFGVLMAFCGNLAGNIQKNIAGRAIITASPFMFKALRNGLQNGAWQTLVLQISLPVSSKVVIYQKGGNIRFIDEIDSTTNFSLTTSWPPILVKHFRIWKRNGLIFEWPEEDSGLISEGVPVAP